MSMIITTKGQINKVSLHKTGLITNLIGILGVKCVRHAALLAALLK